MGAKNSSCRGGGSDQDVLMAANDAGTCSSSATTEITSAPATRKASIAWLEGVEVVQVAVGVENAAAVSSDGKLVLWGSKQNMPSSMLQQAQALAADSDKAAAAEVPKAAATPALDGQQMQATASSAAATDPSEQAASAAAHVAVLVTVTLSVSPNGHVTLSCSYPRAADTLQPHTSCLSPAAQQQNNAARGSSNGQALKVVTDDLADDLANDESSPVEDIDDSRTTSQSVFDPDREPIKEMSCGEAHHVILCQPSQYEPAVGVLSMIIRLGSQSACFEARR